MARIKATVRRLPAKTYRLPAWLVNREYSTRKKKVYLFKIKETLPEQRTVNITKDGQIVKSINVRRKSRYFTGKNRLIFETVKNNFLLNRNIFNLPEIPYFSLLQIPDLQMSHKLKSKQNNQNH